MHVGKWESSFFCVKCDKAMSFHTETHSHGVCPYCGNSSGSTVVGTVTKVRRWIRSSPTWQFWNNIGHWEYKNKNKKKKNEHS